MQLGLWAKDLPSHFPVSFCRVTKTAASIFPACQSEPPASCLISVLYSGGEGLSSTHRLTSEPWPPSTLSPVTLLPLLPPGVALGCILAGSHKLSWSLAIPVRSALEGGSCGCAFIACSSGYAFSVCSPWSSCME